MLVESRHRTDHRAEWIGGCGDSAVSFGDDVEGGFEAEDPNLELIEYVSYCILVDRKHALVYLHAVDVFCNVHCDCRMRTSPTDYI